MRASVLAGVTALSLSAIALTTTAKEARAESGSTESAATQGQSGSGEETPQERRERRERRARREKEAADKAAADKAAAEAAAAAPANPPVASAADANPAPSASSVPVPVPVPVAVAVAVPASAAPTAVAAAAPAGTPLNVVPSKPLELASSKTPGVADSAWKLAALGIAAGVGVWAWKRKKAFKLEVKDEPELRVVRRTSLGSKNELVLVELDGQQILLGVTASAISSLLIIPTSDASDPVFVEEPADSKTKLAAIRESARMFPERDLRDTDIQLPPREARESRDVRQGRVAARPARDTRDTRRKPRDAREARDDRESPAEIVLREEQGGKPTVTTASALARIEGQAEGLLRLRRNA